MSAGVPSPENRARRRQKLLDGGWCINGISHGKAVAGGRRCEACRSKHSTRRDGKRTQRDKRKRDRMRAAGVCVNGWSHGVAVKGGRCAACWARKVEAAQLGPDIAADHPLLARGAA